MANAEAMIQMLNLLPDELPYNPQKEHIADQAAKVSQLKFKVLYTIEVWLVHGLIVHRL